MNDNEQPHASPLPVCTARVNKKRKGWKRAPKLSKSELSDERARAAPEFFHTEQPQLPDAYGRHQRFIRSSRKSTERAGDKFVADAEKGDNDEELFRTGEEQKGTVSDGKHADVSGARGDGRGQGGRGNFLNRFEFNEIRAILDKVSQDSNEPVRDRPAPLRLMQDLSTFVVERKAHALATPPRLTVNAERPPQLVLVLSGVIRSAAEADSFIESEIMKRHVRDNASYFENAIQVVLDLRGLEDVYLHALECIMHRWAPYLNARASKAVLVLPQGTVLKQLQAAAQSVRLRERLAPDVRYKIVYRSRDVKDALLTL